MKIIAATKNKGKIREIEKIFGNLGFEVISQEKAGIDVDIEETGDSFEKNALIKARAVSLLCDCPVIADDSGLCIEALGGRPGVYSARYAGENASDLDRCNKLLDEMRDQKNRKAKFVCCIAFVFPDGREYTASGEVCGKVMDKPGGENGFGYDPIFYCNELGKCFAEASDEEKNSVSHRGIALNNMYKKLSKVFEEKEG